MFQSPNTSSTFTTGTKFSAKNLIYLVSIHWDTLADWLHVQPGIPLSHRLPSYARPVGALGFLIAFFLIAVNQISGPHQSVVPVLFGTSRTQISKRFAS